MSSTNSSAGTTTVVFSFPVIILLAFTVYYLMKQSPMNLPQASETFTEFGPSLRQRVQNLRMKSGQTARGVAVERSEGRFHQ